MTITWPSAFGTPQMKGYSYQDQNNQQRTDVEGGPARVRRMFRQVPTQVQVAWIWTTTTLGMFEGWYRNVVKDGTAWFMGPVETGQGITMQEMRIKEYHPAKKGPREYQVSAVLELRMRPGLSAVETSVLSEDYGFDADLAIADFTDITETLQNLAGILEVT